MLLAAALLLCSACDDGRIYDDTTTAKTGVVVKLTGQLKGMQNWPNKYHISLAGFDDESTYALIAKEVPTPDSLGNVTMTLSGITDDVTSIHLCALNQLRQRVVTFATQDITSTSDTIYMEVGELNISMFQAIQDNIFTTTCSACHNSPQTRAAGLCLVDGYSYDALVGKTSTKQPDLQLVTPGDASSSILYLALSTDTTSTWLYNHSSEVPQTNMLALIKNWIDNGAKQN